MAPAPGGHITVFVQDAFLFQFFFILSVSCQDNTGLYTNPGVQPGDSLREGILDKELSYKGMNFTL